MTESIALLIGLANPEAEYGTTRHNAGSWLVQELLAKFGSEPLSKQSRINARVGQIRDLNLKLAVPLTYMNESGPSVVAASKYYKIPYQQMLIAHDELDLPVGELRLKYGGGHGGHNGLGSIIEQSSTNDFYRLRIGIGRPERKEQVSSYVLSAPSPDEKVRLMQGIRGALSSIELCTQGKMEQAMKAINTQN